MLIFFNLLLFLSIFKYVSLYQSVQTEEEVSYLKLRADIKD